MRVLWLVAGLVVPALAHAADCILRDGDAPPEVTVGDDVVWFTQEIDTEFFNCARKAGGALTLDFLAGKGDALSSVRSRTLSSAHVREAAHRTDLCTEKPGPDALQPHERRVSDDVDEGRDHSGLPVQGDGGRA